MQAGLRENHIRAVEEKETCKHAMRACINILMLMRRNRTVEENRVLQHLQDAHLTVTGTKWTPNRPFRDIFYRNYRGSVHWSELDDCFYGFLKDTEDTIMFEGTSLPSLLDSFKTAVDQYIALQEGTNSEFEDQPASETPSESAGT